MDRPYSTNGGTRKAYRILVGKPDGKEQIGRTRRRWMNDIKVEPRCDVVWTALI
jgi:hypothetical protein